MTTFKYTPKQARKLWCESLRSGKYQQCRGKMTDGVRHCCLDIARVAFIEAEGREPERVRYATNKNLTKFPEVRIWLGLKTNIGRYNAYSLARDNDEGKTFDEIAAIIESEPPGLFKEVRA